MHARPECVLEIDMTADRLIRDNGLRGPLEDSGAIEEITRDRDRQQ